MVFLITKLIGYILSYHMELSIGSYSGEYFYSSNINLNRTLLSIKQAINDIRSLIKYIKKDNNKVIIIGLSMGGLVANLLACCEKNIDLLITIICMGCRQHFRLIYTSQC